MKKVTLYNRKGQALTEINISERDETIDGIQWGGTIFTYNSVHNQWREALIVPAYIRKGKNSETVNRSE